MKNALLIFRRELRDQLRDQRTLFLVLGLPMVLYPAMIYGTAQLNLLHSERTRTVVVLGADSLAGPPLIEGESFAEGYLSEQQAEKLRVLTDREPEEDAARSPEDAKRLAGAVQVRELLMQRKAAEAVRDSAEADEAAKEAAEAESLDLADRIGRLLAATDTQALIVVPDDFEERMDAYDAALSGGGGGGAVPRPTPRVVTNNADDKSQLAADRVRKALKAWENDILKQRLADAGLPADLTDPLETEEIDVAPPEALSANLWSKMFPALLIIMAVTGAFYPAVDVCAGEKERGTMETILICPAKRHEVVFGKFLTVMLFSVVTALLNLLSLGVTAKYVSDSVTSGMPGGGGGGAAGLDLPPMLTLVWIAVLILPLGAFFAATSLALAMFARSTKEGQYYLTPLLIVSMGLTMYAIAPGIEITGLLSLVPVLGPALLLRAVIASPGDPAVLSYFLPVLVSTIAYCVLAMWWAVEQFRSEEIIFRGAEQFDLKLWLKSLVTNRESTPSFGEALVCFVLIMFLQFAATPTLQRLMPTGADAQTTLMQLLVIQQACLIALPALLMGYAFTRSMRETFKLRWPAAGYLAAGVLLPILLHAPTTALSMWMGQHIFPEPAKWIVEAFAPLSNVDIPAWKVVLAFAVMPAICEEIAFRGFLLSGFARRGRTGLGIALSSVSFGLIHMIPAQMFNAALLGLVLGLLAVRSRSLLPCVIFHMIYNGLQAARGRVSADAVDPTGGWLFNVDSVSMNGVTSPHLTYGGVTIGLSLAIALPWLWAIYRDRANVGEERREGDETLSAQCASSAGRSDGVQEAELSVR